VPFGAAQAFVRVGETIFLYDTPFSHSLQDARKAPDVALSLTAAQVPGACATENPEDPHCLNVLVVGEFDSHVTDAELEAAQQAMWLRHPIMGTWAEKVPFHHFNFWALRVKDVWASGEREAATTRVEWPLECSQELDAPVETWGFRLTPA